MMLIAADDDFWTELNFNRLFYLSFDVLDAVD
jgi:hypothetical protein